MNKQKMSILIVIAGMLWLLPGCTGAPAVPTDTPLAALPSNTSLPPSATTVPTTTSTPTPTELPTETPLPTATFTATPDRTATAQFKATSTAEGLLSEISKELEAIELSSDSGYLLWAQDEPVYIDLIEWQQWLYDPLAGEPAASDFVFKSDITWESTGGLVACGLIFRSEDNIEVGKQYLYVMTRLSGFPAWDITYYQYGDFQKSISDVRTNSAIKQEQGSTNKVLLIAEGEKFTVYINDIRAGSFYDYSKSMLEGLLAFTAWQESGESTCTFANTWVWALK